jgi:NADH-quinone oxidoreductase subunit K
MKLMINFVSFTMFSIGLIGIITNRKNIILILIAVELCLLSVNFTFLIYSLYFDDLVGQLFALFVLTVAAAETSVGLAILVLYYRIKGTVTIDSMMSLKG